jgi:hypothetical protein
LELAIQAGQDRRQAAMMPVNVEVKFQLQQLILVIISVTKARKYPKIAKRHVFCAPAPSNELASTTEPARRMTVSSSLAPCAAPILRLLGERLFFCIYLRTKALPAPSMYFYRFERNLLLNRA